MGGLRVSKGIISVPVPFGGSVLPIPLAQNNELKFDVPGSVSSEGGKCMIDAVDARPWAVKTIADDDDEYTGIETMEGSFPMTLWVLKSWIHPSGVTVIGVMASGS